MKKEGGVEKDSENRRFQTRQGPVGCRKEDGFYIQGLGNHRGVFKMKDSDLFFPISKTGRIHNMKLTL